MLPETTPLPAQRRVGRYLITGRIGRGGMGMVYRGLDEALEREVALKTLGVRTTADDEGRRRFEIEARAAARLQHPNIVTVHELGEDRGVPFIAMELLGGSDLETLLRSGEDIPLAEKLDLMLQVCRGLAYAHERGIVHRDVKPSNIRALEDGTAKIMDFGIAKLDETRITRTGMMVGTIHYMSPEQVRGQALDGRSDVFSVGVILYELLSGERPFRGDEAAQVLYRIVNDPVPALDPAPLGSIGPRLTALVARTLAKDPAERPASAGQVAEELAALLEVLQKEVGPPPPAALEAVATARRALRAGRADEAARALGAVVAAHPTVVEARRLLRAARGEQQRRQQPPEATTDEFSELDATFRVAPTQREPETEIRPTELVRSGPTAPAPVVTTSAGAERRRWLLVAGVAAVLLSVGVALALRGTSKGPGAGAAADVRLRVRSAPLGAMVLVDGRDSGVVTNGEIVLPSPLPPRVVLTFRKEGHVEETRTVDLPFAGEAVSVTLQVAVAAVPVTTEPAGAAVALDGQRVPGATPLEVTLDPAREHRLTLSMEGYLTQEVRVPAGQRPADLRVRLEPLAPPGTVAVASAYPLDVLWRGKPMTQGEASPRLRVAGGRQVLTLVSTSLFLRTDVTVDVPSGGEVVIEAPPVGRVSIRAIPDNCEVSIDGRFVDYPPILERPLAVGPHTITFRWSDGRKVDQTIDVRPGPTNFVTGRRS